MIPCKVKGLGAVNFKAFMAENVEFEPTKVFAIFAISGEILGINLH